ncbi:MAG: hypothetical protein HC941_25505 [Microcoleus sp. SU_5_3]|nr:hypothetical protein [Microcoleus sp. SU_5_3]
MVRSNNAKAPTKTVQKFSENSNTQKNKTVDSCEIDPELFNREYNQTRKPSLPYGIIINDNPAGILIPSDQLAKAEWYAMPNVEELTTVELTEKVTGLLLQKARMLVLAFVPEYIRYKDIEENGELAGTFIGLYDEYRDYLDKKTQEVCSEHALIFLNSKNQPLHQIPIVVRFRNVALWSFKSAREEFYRNLERAFADRFGRDYSGKNDKWRSLGVLNVEFRALKEGEGKNKSFCCKTYSITRPTPANFHKLFLGQKQQKELIWGLHNSIAGFTDASDTGLPVIAAGVEPKVQALPESVTSRKGRNKLSPPRKIAQVEAETDSELEDKDDFSEAAEVEVEVDSEEDFDFDEPAHY